MRTAIRELFFEAANVRNQVFDLVVFELACVGRHLAFAFGDGLDKLRVGLFLDIGGCEVMNAHLETDGRTLTIGSMAHRTLCFESGSGVLSNER